MSFNVHAIRSLTVQNRISGDDIAAHKMKQHIERRIRSRAQKGQECTTYIIQAIMLYCPAYNRSAVASALVQWLQNSGFGVSLNKEDYCLYINWGENAGNQINVLPNDDNNEIRLLDA